ncbi:electron-transfer flavoprotein:ubiquinone oxidoreductase [Chlorobium sp. KB01]|uniref:electron transfer flavoprotein-ubiquinone oxidoreductase n=1 Tax=Chlorobium sp. KB01 TaxID=1917528 RepID=UPI000975EECC|nr:electron-transfer flavoprotein:ubiquinone oxidoreductase [Chlorobium sp. KB01]
MQKREALEFDILFVGAGPANLASAIHLQRLLKRHNATAANPLEPSIAVIEKGRYAGAHLLSGALLDPRALDEFFPDYRAKGCPVEATVSKESIWFLQSKRKFAVPFIPEPFSNKNSLIVSLSRLGAWMAEQAENEGVQLFDNTAASAPFMENGKLTGIITDDKGIGKDGNSKTNFEPGLLLKAKAIVIGEGSDGSLTRQLSMHFPSISAAQRYETGVKETWEIPEERITAGEVHHTFGFPLESDVYGGGWLYAFSPTLVSVGCISSVGHDSPVCDPHLNLQRFKLHPLIANILKSGKMVESGARTITSGGLDAMPPLCGPGYLLTGESAGMVNMQRHKGIHLAMKSGTIAAETLFEALLHNDFSTGRLKSSEERFRNSWAWEELHAARNYRKAFDKGLYSGLVQAGLQLGIPGLSLKTTQLTLPGFTETPSFNPKKKKIALPVIPEFRADGMRTFSKERSLFSSGVMHEENQPCHLVIKREDIAEICLKKCKKEFANPCQHFCPAGVYEITTEPVPALKLNPSNCLHCKTCEIADPYGIITWTTPEGGGGPGYKLS